MVAGLESQPGAAFGQAGARGLRSKLPFDGLVVDVHRGIGDHSGYPRGEWDAEEHHPCGSCCHGNHWLKEGGIGAGYPELFSHLVPCSPEHWQFLGAGSRQGCPSCVTLGWKCPVGARVMDGVASGASLGWGLHPSSLEHEIWPVESHGMLRIQPARWDSSSARAMNPHETGTSTCHVSPGTSLPSGDIQDCGRARWGPVPAGPEGREDPVLPRALPKAPSSKHLAAIPLSREAVPELRGQLPAPPTPGGSGLGFEVRWGLGNRGWEEGREALQGGKGRAAAGEGPGCSEGICLSCPGCPVKGEHAFCGEEDKH